MEETEFFAAVVERLDQLIFLGQVVGISVSFLSGMYLWRLVVLSKNQRSVF